MAKYIKDYYQLTEAGTSGAFSFFRTDEQLAAAIFPDQKSEKIVERIMPKDQLSRLREMIADMDGLFALGHFTLHALWCEPAKWLPYPRPDKSQRGSRKTQDPHQGWPSYLKRPRGPFFG